MGLSFENRVIWLRAKVVLHPIRPIHLQNGLDGQAALNLFEVGLFENRFPKGPFVNALSVLLLLQPNMPAMSQTNQTTMQAPITITDNAMEQLRRIMREEAIPSEYGLRVGVKGGGCSGFTYILGFDKPAENDNIYELNGLKVLMQKAHAIYLVGMEIDWHDGLDNRGFIFNNPNAKSTCGCGTSFSA